MAQPEPVHGYTEPEIAAAEGQFDALIDAGITAAVAAAVAAVLAEPITSTVTDAIFAPIFTLWNAYTAEVLIPELTRVYLGSGEMFLDTLAGEGPPAERGARLMLAYDLDEDLPLLDEPAAVWMAAASNRLRNVGSIVWEEIREQLVEGIKAGDGIKELAARVEQASGFAAARAVKTARTECLPGETEVDLARVTALYRRWHEGEWVEIVTASGRKLSGTPNHPVLGLSGWVGLGQLNEGDGLICHSGRAQGSGPSSDVDIKNRPPTIAEIFDAVSTVCVPERDRAGKPDFHGDGMDGYVDVLRPDWVLTLGESPALGEGSLDNVLTPSDASRIIGFANSQIFPRDIVINKASRRIPVADWDARQSQASSDPSLCTPVFLGERLDGTARLVRGQDGGGWKILAETVPEPGFHQEIPGCGPGTYDSSPSDDVAHYAALDSGGVGDALGSQPAEIEIDYVLSISVGMRSGHVYNLTTVEGYFVANEVYTSNTAAASNGGSITQARALGLDMDKQWEATFPTDGRTRPTHLAAHGQTVGLNDKFVVGDSLLDFPADPLGEADETINCRCAVTYVRIRRRAEVPVVAAGFDEAEHPRDGEGKFAEQAGEDLGVLASVVDLYGPIVEELEWGDQTSGSADPVYGWLTVHKNGDSALSVYSEDRDEAWVILDGSDSSAWTELADRIERVRGMWEDADPEDSEGEDERQLIDGLGTGRDGDIGVGYDKDGLINIYMVDQGKGNFDLWLDGDETDSLIETLEEAARLIDEAQTEDDEEDVDLEVSAAVTHFVEGQHPRDSDGKFADKTGGGGKTPSIPGDKLGLAKRIKLKDGEELRGSREFDVGGNSVDTLVGAAIATPDGPEVRIGIVGGDDTKKWSARDLGSTLKLKSADVDRITEVFDKEMAKGKARQKELQERWDELDELEYEVANPDPDIDPGDQAEAEARLAELQQWKQDLEIDALLSEGVIPAGEWGDLAYQMRGEDDGEGGWVFLLGVQDDLFSPGDWYFPGSEPDGDAETVPWSAELDSADMRMFLKQLGQLATKAAPAPEKASAAPAHTGAMIALVPSAEHVDRLAVDGGEPAEELHLTVMYLGEAADIPEDIRAAVYDVVAGYAAKTPPIEGDGFAVEAFNPHTTERDTALVMGVGGQSLADLHAGVSGHVGKLMTPPDNHAPWRPHVTLKYSDDLGELPGFVDRLGPVTFDRLRVAMGGEVTDYPLVGGNDFDVESWAAGNAGKLRLGQPGGFRRCVKRLRDEPGVTDPEGLCATMHHEATGKWPSEGHIVTAAASEDMPPPDQLAAALDYEEQLATAVPGAHFHTLMHTEGVSTGRRVQMPGSWTWRTPPIPFNWEKRTAMHGGVPEVVTVGLVTDIARTGREIHGWGMIDLDDPNGLDYARKLAEGWVRGVSVGPDEQPMDMELIYSPTDPETVIQEVFHSGNIYEVTSSDGVAQATAYVEPLPALIEALAERGIEVARAAFEETKHKRDNGGKFAKKAGGGVPSADAPDAPTAKTAKEPKAPRAPRAKTAAKKAPVAAEASPTAAPKAGSKKKAATGDVGSLLRPSGSKAAARKNPKATAAAAVAMNGTFGGVEVRVDKATQSAGKTHVLASLYDAEGNKVGTTERTFHRGNGDDPDALWVSHDLLALQPQVQGAGFAQEWNAHTEKWYRESGVSHIGLEANIDVGGYAWARQGYDFADQATAEKIRDRAAGILDALTFELDFATPGSPAHDRALARAAGAQDLLDRFNNNEYGSAGYPTPADVADAGRQPGQGRADQWFGKLALLNSKWDGVKWL